MKLKKLGIEWGAAFEEAQPLQITSQSGEVVLVIYEREDGKLALETFESLKLERLDQHYVKKNGDLRVVIGG